MSAQNLSRKRAAPGADPIGYSSQQMQPVLNPYSNGPGPQLSDDQFLQWGQLSQPQNMYQDHPMFDTNATQPNQQSNNAVPSNQIARRPISQVATRPVMNAGQWPNDINATAPGGGNVVWEDDLEELEQKAQAAKKEAQVKRKAIPPFVLKLRSFLDDGKNGDLIRWTDDGKSFVVLDEDEFAKKLIPELFKHNNYASFVRQLNMYGFHKKVGLSDNSMRASERKSKSPSEYSNPYFREGYYDLMWLIQKPKNVTATTRGKGKSKQEGDGNDASEEMQDDFVPESRMRAKPLLSLPDASSSSLTAETLQSVQRELVAIRHQQAQISKMMTSLKREHEQLYGQAATFQDQHTRHENSINAILTFLATVYKGGLPNQEAAAGITNFFGNPSPQSNTTGNIVDVGDYNFDQYPDMNSRGPFKKQPLLLTNGQSTGQNGAPQLNTNSYIQNARRSSQLRNKTQIPNTGQVEELPDFGSNATTPQPPANSNGHSRQDMMAVIRDTNARNPSPSTPAADFNSVLSDLEKSRASTPLSDSQRENVLRMINRSTNQIGDNALINAIPPSGPTNFDRHLASTTADLDALAKMQAQQDQSVQKLADLLQPLSPSGSIPGIGDGQNFPAPTVDIEDLFNNDYFPDLAGDPDDSYHNFNTDAAPPDIVFDWDGTGHNDNDDDDDEELFGSGDGNGDFTAHHGFDLNAAHHASGGGRVESVASSEVTTPKHSYAGSELDEGGGENHHTSSAPSKGRKLSVTNDSGNNKRRRKS